jgi:transcriptional regulator with XRE-family HTH domain
MPRRDKPDPLARRIGQRIRALREEQGVRQERLAYESEPRSRRRAAGREHGLSKGHVSSIEGGLVMPTVATLQAIADRLGVLVADLVTDPSEGDRATLLELTRGLPAGALRKLVRELSAAATKKKAE